MPPRASSPGDNLMLPVSDPPPEHELDRLLGDVEDDDVAVEKEEKKLFKGSAMTTRGAYAAVSYMVCAVLLVMFNKAALSSYRFPCANVITLFQMICSCFFLYILRRWKMITFTARESLVFSDSNATIFVPLKTLKKTVPLAGAYLMYMLCNPSMESVRGVNVPMYTTLRRTTVVFTMVMEYFLARQRYTSRIVGSVGLIVLGAFIAGARDLSFDAYGYAVVFLSNIATAVYLATIARIGKSSGLNSFGLMWCNGIFCGPALLVLTFFHGDLKMTIDFPYLLSPGFMVVLLCSCVLAFFLNYCIFLNTTLNSATPPGSPTPNYFGTKALMLLSTLNSALTQIICGNLKDFFTIGLGWVIFGGLPFDILNVIGQGLGFLGSGLYAYNKLVGK